MSATVKTAAVEPIVATTGQKEVRRTALGTVAKGSAALNPGGLTKEARAVRDLMRGKLCGDANEVHDALMGLIRDGNAPATIYAHQLLHGKDAEQVNVRHSRSAEDREPTDEEMRSAELIAKAWMAQKT